MIPRAVAEMEAAAAKRRPGEDLGIAVHLILRSVPAIDDLIRALDAAGGSVRLVKALRVELALRRGGQR